YGEEHYSLLASGNSAVDAAAFLQLDPTALANGFYTLRLRVVDLAGRRGEASIDVEIDSATKQPQLLRSETDFVLTVAGHDLPFARSYDSLARSIPGSFGEGWRLAFRDVDLQNDAALTGRETAGVLGTFADGQRVFVTLPDGQRTAFTFTPQKRSIPGQTWYLPAFVAADGSGWSLEAPATVLQRAGSSYFDLLTGKGYNPANAAGTDYLLVAPDGTRYSIGDGEVREIAFADGVRLLVSDSGIVASNGQRVQFSLNADGFIDRVVADDGRQFLYDYDALGRLLAVRDLEGARSLRYGYEEGALGRLAIRVDAAGGKRFDYGASAVVQQAITADLGSSLGYLATSFSGDLAAGEEDRLAFTLRDSELASTASGAVYLGLIVEGSGGLLPQIPVLQGLSPVASSVQGNRAFALYRLDRAGLKLIEVSAASAGSYQLSLFVAGDANRDGKADGRDAVLIAAAAGLRSGDAGYALPLDADANGVVDSLDLQLLMQNTGFTPNQAPVVVAGTVRTHEDLDVSAPVSSFVTDPEGDRSYFSIVGANHGTARLSGDGRSVIFAPETGFVGSADFT
ncbi:MAG: hypothetical protein KDI64_12570, partial [Candidatus Accumulibacter sp.]|nr:hypothetical protein [Accumulibacter sp.]